MLARSSPRTAARRRRRTVLIAAALCAAAVGAAFTPSESTARTAPAAREANERAEGQGVRVRAIRYVAHNGRRLVAYVALPAWYHPDPVLPIPLVIAPHGRWATARTIVHRFGRLPAVGGFAVVSPEGHGRRDRQMSWGYSGQVDDLARMPAVVERALPWLEIDRTRVYAVGASMGGQETLLLAARHPRLLAGVAAFDPIADLALQYRNFRRIGCLTPCLRRWGRPLGHVLRGLARREVGGTPETAPRAYAARSPLARAGELAFSGVPIQLWWTWKDRTVMQPNRQAAALYRRLRRLNPTAPVEGFPGGWSHGRIMSARTGLRAALTRFGLVPWGEG